MDQAAARLGRIICQSVMSPTKKATSYHFPIERLPRIMASEIETLLDEIGKIVLLEQPDQAISSLMLVQIGNQVVSINIFDDLGRTVRYRMPDRLRSSIPQLSDLLFELQQVHHITPRWCEMDYFLQGSHFKAKFRYADEVDPERDTLEIRRDLLRPYFGDRPVVYPPMESPDGAIFDWELE